MNIHVLGSAAGGGFPQWNCGCANCAGVRANAIAAQPRSQTCLAIESEDGSWFLVHASPDIRTQLLGFPPLHPRTLRDSPISGVLLTNADLDQCLGLLSLRESQPLHVYSTEAVRQAFTVGNRLYQCLCRTPDQITWHELKLDSPQALIREDNRLSSLSVTALPVPGKPPLYLEDDVSPCAGDNIGLLFRDRRGDRTCGYAPCVGGPGGSVDRLLDEADCLLFDGTFWSDDELLSLGIGRRTARQMAHWPLGGPDGSLAVLFKARACRRLLIHINNSNPILRDDSPERREVERAGVAVAYDGLEITV
ncbi:MAG: pyrroloquinoline quinone biosynthesis protein PqqB [Nitrospira sp.]